MADTRAAVALARIRAAASAPWDPAGYLAVHAPVVVADLGRLAAEMTAELARGRATNVLDLAVKLPGGPVTVPAGLPGWAHRVVDVALAAETHHVGDVDPWHVYLTVHQSVVPAGASQRRGGVHFDGMQGAAYPVKLPGCHAYLLATAAPTVFYPHPFDLRDLDERTHNFFRACETQKDPRCAWAPAPGQLVLASCYAVHESPPVPAGGPRTFVRVEFSRKRFDRDGNTRNRSLDTRGWAWRPRPIPAHLR